MRASAERASEVNAALDLVLGAMQGQGADGEAGFELPSRMSTEQLRQLANG